MHSTSSNIRNKFDYLNSDTDFKLNNKNYTDKSNLYLKSYKNNFTNISPINNSLDNSTEEDPYYKYNNFIDNKTENTAKPLLNNNFNTFNQSAYDNPSPDDEILILKFREFESEIADKQKTIDHLNKKLSNKNQKLSALDSKVNNMQETINQYEVNLNHLYSIRQQFDEAEKELEKYRVEVGRLHEALSSKDSINREFQNLAKETMIKFDYYDMTNNELLLENKMLKKELNEFRDKIREIYSNKNNINNINSLNKENNTTGNNTPDKFDIDVEVLILKDFISKEIEKEITKLNNDSNKEHTKIKEEFQTEHAKIKEKLSSTLEENSNLKKENFQLKKSIEENEKELRDKEFHFKLEIENKNREIEQSISAVRSAKKQIKEIENEYKFKLTENSAKFKIFEEKERKLINEQEVKQKQLNDSCREIDIFNKKIKAFELELSDLQKRVEELEEKNRELNGNNEELLRAVEKKNNEIIELDDNHEKEISNLLSNIEEMKAYHQNLTNENDDLKINIKSLNTKLKEQSEIIEKYHGVELVYSEEKNNNENLNKNIKELNKRMKVNEEKNYLKVSKLKKEIANLEETLQNMNYKYEEKVKKVSL